MIFKQKVTVYSWQIGLLYHRGVFVRSLEPGRYEISKRAGEEIYTYETRPTMTQIALNDISTADKIGISVVAVIPRRIVDPQKMLENVQDIENHVRQVSYEFLREKVRQHVADDIVTAVADIATELRAYLGKKLPQVGVEVTDNLTVDVSLPRNVKRAFEAELIARKKALADMEEARGKTAVLRHLANAAKLVDENPSLYKLLLSQKVRSLSIEMDEPTKASKSK